jgi:mono/diheme cytochrome c family protein
MKSLLKIIAFVILISLVSSCKNDLQPNYQYMPNMYVPVGYEAYGDYDVFPDGQSALLPPEGTIPRGHSLFEYENTTEGYNLAKETLKSPLDSTEVDLDKGKFLFDIYCSICHGVKGDGQGNLVKREKILGVPRYDDAARAINEGSIYYTIYYGKNAMGTYANQLSENERWQVVDYVINLKRSLEGLPPIDYQKKSESMVKLDENSKVEAQDVVN